MPDPSLIQLENINACEQLSSSRMSSNGRSNNNNNNNNINNNCTYASVGDPPAVELKIIGHLRNIEKINEKRHNFLQDQRNNSASCQRNDWREEVKNSNNAESFQSVKIKADRANGVATDKTMSLQLRSAEGLLDSSTTDPEKIASTKTNCNTALKSPPPKPPMLSRNRSLGTNNSNTINNNNNANNNTDNKECSSATSAKETDLKPAASPIPTGDYSSVPSNTTALVTAEIITVPTQVDTMDCGEAPVLRRSERPKSLAPTADVATPKQISVNHYERLIEELKCPGCAFPMKGQVLLCKTGHSICAQCTRVLMLCPLCKEPFTNIRSLTVEALCSKAHFRCANASGGCTVRLQIDLLNWHEKQCIYKPMKCFMGRVYGDCTWTGREANWKNHLETNHSDRVFTEPTADLTWDMSIKQKPLTGYYVFQVYGEMFNFYEVYDKERLLFTMSCTSTVREKKLNFAFEVTAIHKDNEALAITQKFPVHSEYDKDILMEGTCVSMSLADLAKFIDCNRILHYRVRVLEVKSPRKNKVSRNSSPNPATHPCDFQNTKIEGVNLKHVPAEVIVTRRIEPPSTSTSSTAAAAEPAATTSSDEDFDIRRQYQRSKFGKSCKDGCCNSDSDPEFEAFVAKKWGTPQMHFNRKYLNNPSSEISSAEGSSNQSNNCDVLKKFEKRFHNDVDKMSLCSTNTSYKKKVTNSIRKSFRNLKTDIIDLKPFGKKSSPGKNVAKFN